MEELRPNAKQVLPEGGSSNSAPTKQRRELKNRASEFSRNTENLDCLLNALMS